jgi:3-hydroxyisobutyrate dehydrogenase-like beta-hydroxyacid dehydrogenase
MLATVMEGAAELQAAGERASLNPEDVFWALTRIVPALEARRTGLLENRHSPALFALRDLQKDVALAESLFAQSAAPTPLVALARELVTAAAVATPDLDISAVARPYLTA